MSWFMPLHFISSFTIWIKWVHFIPIAQLLKYCPLPQDKRLSAPDEGKAKSIVSLICIVPAAWRAMSTSCQLMSHWNGGVAQRYLVPRHLTQPYLLTICWLQISASWYIKRGLQTPPFSDLWKCLIYFKWHKRVFYYLCSICDINNFLALSKSRQTWKYLSHATWELLEIWLKTIYPIFSFCLFRLFLNCHFAPKSLDLYQRAKLHSLNRVRNKTL